MFEGRKLLIATKHVKENMIAPILENTLGVQCFTIVDFDTAIKLNAKNPVSYNYRGVAKGESRQFVEALKDFDYAIKLKYDYAGAFVNRAAVKFASKDKHGACDDLNKADSLGDEMAIQLIETYCKH